MIVLVNIDGTVAAADLRLPIGRSVVMPDEDLYPEGLGSFADLLARPGTTLPMFSRQYMRTRRLLPDPRNGPAPVDTTPLFLYEEQTAPGSMPPEQRAVRLPQVEAAAARLAEKGRALRLAGAGGAREAALAVARDAWLEGRLDAARAILRAEMTEEVALATAQQWLAEAWRELVSGGGAG